MFYSSWQDVPPGTVVPPHPSQDTSARSDATDVDFAKASDIAVLGIGHLTKGTAGKDPLERLNGSGAFGRLARGWV